MTKTRAAGNRVAGVTFGRATRWMLLLIVALLPALHSWGYAEHWWWLAAWFVLFTVRETLRNYDEGKKQEHVALDVARVNNSVSGTIDSISRGLMRTERRSLSELETRTLAASLLHRIRDFSEHALCCPKEVGLRVTLAVPWNGANNDEPKSLRVWCYDQPHADRRFTQLELPQSPSEQALPGSPTAFVTGRLQILNDVHEIDGPHAFRDRNFRSVLSVPVQRGGPDGEVLAVVNVDATQPSFFKETRVSSALLPLIGPSISLLALVLQVRSEEARYEFLS